MKKVGIVALLAAVVMATASCGKPEGGITGTGDEAIVYAGKNTETCQVNETWYPPMTGGSSFMEGKTYMVVTDGANKVTVNSDGSITCNESGQIKLEFYVNDTLDKKVILMVTGY